MKKLIYHKAVTLLSKPAISFLVLTLAILSRSLQLIFFYNMRNDNSYMFLATQSLVNGNGFSMPYVLGSNLSSTFYEPMIMWPPGYSFLLSPLFIIFNHNYVAAGITLDIIFGTLLILYTRKILQLFPIPIYIINVFTLITSFFTYYFYFIASTDSTTICVCTIAIYYILHALKLQTHMLRNGIIISICLLFCGLLKYLFIPVAFVLPLFLLIIGLSKHNKKLTHLGLSTFITFLFGMLALYFYQKTAAGTVGYISAKGRGFYLEHLKSFYPYLTASFLREETATWITGIQTTVIHNIFKVLHLLLLITNIAIASYLVFKRGIQNLNLQEQFFLLFTCISLSITILLASLSLVVEKEIILDYWLWTYIQEPRYHGLISVLLHMSVFIFYFYTSRNMIFYKPFLIICFLSLFIECCRGVVFVTNRVRLWGIEEYSWKKELRFQKYADGLIKKFRKQYPVEKVVVASAHEYYINRISLYNHIPILKDTQMINSPELFATQQPTLLLVMIKETQQHLHKNFLLKYKQQEVGRFEDYAFYTLLIKPAS